MKTCRTKTTQYFRVSDLLFSSREPETLEARSIHVHSSLRRKYLTAYKKELSPLGPWSGTG